MPSPTYTLIEKYTTTTTQASVVLGSGGTIPQTYNDLKIIYSSRVNNVPNIVDDVTILLNGSSSSFTMKRLFGDGTSATSDTAAPNYNWVAQVPNASATANTFGNAEFYIPNYTNSNTKMISADSVGENNNATSYQFIGAIYWGGTSPITSITLSGLSSSFVANSTFYLYGITNS